jgi:Tol biopolymer transport system component
VVTRAHEYLASLSPDGRWLAYVSNASAGWRVYLADLERGGRPQVVGAGQDPFWSADGAALFFLQAGRLAAVRPPERGVSDLTTLGDLPALERIVRARALGSGGFIAALSG